MAEPAFQMDSLFNLDLDLDLPKPAEKPAAPPATAAEPAKSEPVKIEKQPANDAAAADSQAEEEENILPGRKGRPRSEKSRKKILDAANKLLLHMSVQELSIEAIAKKAKVGKTTIYRWWPNKTAVVMDALISQPGMQSPMPTPHNNTDAVTMQLDKLIRLLSSKNGEVIAQLFSEAQADRESLKIFESNFLGPLIDALQFSIEQGQADGEFSKSLTARMAVDMLCGPIFFRLMAHPADMNEEFQKTYPGAAVNLIKA